MCPGFVHECPSPRLDTRAIARGRRPLDCDPLRSECAAAPEVEPVRRGQSSVRRGDGLIRRHISLPPPLPSQLVRDCPSQEVARPVLSSQGDFCPALAPQGGLCPALGRHRMTCPTLGRHRMTSALSWRHRVTSSRHGTSQGDFCPALSSYDSCIPTGGRDNFRLLTRDRLFLMTELKVTLNRR